MATKLENGTISNLSNAPLGKIMTSGAPADLVGNFTTSYVQTQVNNFTSHASFQNTLSTGLSMASQFSATISIAEAAIHLAQSCHIVIFCRLYQP
jgi:hypothetical protein